MSRLSSESAPATTDATSLRVLYEQYGGGVYGRCFYLLKDHTRAEDALQDVFAKALINSAQFRHEASPVHWLMKIATNHCLNLLRAERAPWHARFQQDEEARSALQQPTGGPRQVEDREIIRRVLMKVDPETQAVAVHYHVDEMTLDEIATLLGRSVPTIRKRLEAFAAAGATEM